MTGATGYLGAAVAAALLRRGHAVAALVRSDAGARRVAGLGMQPVRGDLADPVSYLAPAQAADAIVHCAFEYLDDGREDGQLDIMAGLALQRAAQCGGRRLVYTSNAYLPSIAAERCIDGFAEADSSRAPHDWRLLFERRLLDGSRDVLVSVIRPGMVYGGYGGGTIADLFDTAERCRMLPYAAEQASNRWSLVHLDDIAALYADVVGCDAPGVFHAVDGNARTVEDVVQAVASTYGVEALPVPADAAARHLSPHAIEVMCRDVALDAPRSRALGWRPRHADFAAGVGVAYAERVGVRPHAG